jgi:hypothetical protein
MTHRNEPTPRCSPLSTALFPMADAPSAYPPTPPSERDILVAARALIEQPKAWTQGKFARGKKGNPVSASSRKATCWCAQGAIMRAQAGSIPAGFRAHDRIRAVIRGSITRWNDAPERTHAEVLAAFDRAISDG